MDRKAELEKKRKKLEELRKSREARQIQSTLNLQSKISAVPSRDDERHQVSQLLTELIGPDKEFPDATSVTASSEDISKPIENEPSASLSVSANPAESLPLRKAELEVSQIFSTDIPPRESILYSKHSQTESFMDVSDSDVNQVLDPSLGMEENAVPNRKKEDVADCKASDAETQHDKNKEESSSEVGKPHAIPALSESEIEVIMNSENFHKFFSRTSKLVERALNQPYDITIDYEKSSHELNSCVGKDASRDFLQSVQTFWDMKLTKSRAVTCIDWNKKHEELTAVSYHDDPEYSTDSDGLVLIWNSFSPSRPEYVFHCHSAITSLAFGQFHPNLILGGTYSGQIVLWDNRAKSSPVQRSPLSSDYHTHPVYSLHVVGTQNAHNVVTVSTEGRMCTWALDMLSEPQDTLELVTKQNKSVPATCTAFVEPDTNKFLLGSEDGQVYLSNRLGAKRGVCESLGAHAGPITGVDIHPMKGMYDFSDLILSSSMDWSVNLWSQKNGVCLHQFDEFGDYVYDVQWSPSHSAVFAAVDGNHKLSIWNLAEEVETAKASCLVDTKSSLNKLKFSASGDRIAVGDAQGGLFLYKVDESLRVATSDDVSRMNQITASFMEETNRIREDPLH